MNAISHYTLKLPFASLGSVFGAKNRQDVMELAQNLSLVDFLNALPKSELIKLGEPDKDKKTDAGQLRARLWLRGAELESGTPESLGQPWQPLPVVLSSKLVVLGPTRGLYPDVERFPRDIPDPIEAPPRAEEPDTLEALLEQATSLLGLRLGLRGTDKGFYGSKIEELLGVQRHGHDEPDWRGEVEIKTVPVVREKTGLWKVTEDPAVCMAPVDPFKKLGRVLWIARAASCPESPLLSWYFQENDDIVGEMFLRALHLRPKGPKGTSAKGWYVRKSFFAESGFLRSLNG